MIIISDRNKKVICKMMIISRISKPCNCSKTHLARFVFRPGNG